MPHLRVASVMHLRPARGSVMVGFVTTRHLFTYSALIVSEFGMMCMLRCLWRMATADHAVTFLEFTVPTHRLVPSLGTPTSLDGLPIPFARGSRYASPHMSDWRRRSRTGSAR
jgi:hypothetical protein